MNEINENDKIDINELLKQTQQFTSKMIDLGEIIKPL